MGVVFCTPYKKNNMAPKTTEKTPSAAAKAPIKKTKKTPTKQPPTKQPAKPAPPVVHSIITQAHLKKLLRQIDHTAVFSSGAGILALRMLNRVADKLIALIFSVRPLKHGIRRESCTRTDVEIALRSFLPVCEAGEDSFRMHMKEEIDKYFANHVRVKAHEAKLRAEKKTHSIGAGPPTVAAAVQE
jgi:hypothetical protein